MEVSLLNVKITFQKNAVAVDGIGNHKNTWADYYSCHATAGGEAGKQTSEADVAGTVADESDVSFTVKYSLQGTTQGNGLTGADMPVRFSM